MQGRRFRREFRGDEHAKLPVWLYYDQLAEFVLYQSVTIAVHRRAVHGPWSRVAQFDRHSNHSSSLFFQPDLAQLQANSFPGILRRRSSPVFGPREPPRSPTTTPPPPP